MDLKQKREIIHQSYEALNKIHRPLKACRYAHLTADFLQHNNIVVSHLDWRPEEIIDLEPRFCEPFPTEKFDSIFKRTRAANYHGSNTSEFMQWVSEHYEEARDESSQRLEKSAAAISYLQRHIGWNEYPIHMAAGSDWYPCGSEKLYKGRGSQWKDESPSVWGFDYVMRSLPWPQDELPTDERRLERLKRKLRSVAKGDMPVALNEAIRRPGKKSLVHMAISTSDDSNICEDKLLRSELIGAIYIIRDGMRQRKCLEQHAIYPVFVYSWSAFHVRILQVHYDFNTGKLMVRKTSYIEIDGPHREAEIKLVLRWMMNIPKGETRWEELDITAKVFELDVNSKDRPPSPKKNSIQCP